MEEVEEWRERGEQLGKNWEGKRRKFCVLREERPTPCPTPI